MNNIFVQMIKSVEDHPKMAIGLGIMVGIITENVIYKQLHSKARVKKEKEVNIMIQHLMESIVQSAFPTKEF